MGTLDKTLDEDAGWGILDRDAGYEDAGVNAE